MNPFRLCQSEYGVPATVAGARQWARVGSPRPPRRITSAAEYVGVCRRIARRALPPEYGGPPLLEGGGRVDGRLVAVGFRRVPPREWVLGDRRDGRAPRTLADFVAWWAATQGRPGTVGSNYNADTEAAYRLWAAGPHVRRAVTRIPCEEWHRVVGPRGLRRRWLRHSLSIGRALRRSTARHSTISAQALRRLGELPADLQAVALRGARERAWTDGDGGRHPVVRLRHLDWGGVRRAEVSLARDTTGRVAAALAYRRPERQSGRLPDAFVSACETGAGSTDPAAWAEWLCPAYPRATLDQAVRMCLGESPVEISGGGLTRREAHEWLAMAPDAEPAQWLTRRLPGAPRVRSVAVARWLLDLHRRGGWGQLTRERVVHGPAGQVARHALIDAIDEIQDVDLAEGPRTRVETAFERAAERLARAREACDPESDTELAPPPRWRLYRGMRVLTTPRQLAAEGRDLGHCVAGYGPAVQSGQCVILSLAVGGHRSTAELSLRGQVYQHRGPQNTEPHPIHQRVLKAFVERRIAC